MSAKTIGLEALQAACECDPAIHPVPATDMSTPSTLQVTGPSQTFRPPAAEPDGSRHEAPGDVDLNLRWSTLDQVRQIDRDHPRRKPLLDQDPVSRSSERFISSFWPVDDDHLDGQRVLALGDQGHASQSQQRAGVTSCQPS